MRRDRHCWLSSTVSMVPAPARESYTSASPWSWSPRWFPAAHGVLFRGLTSWRWKLHLESCSRRENGKTRHCPQMHPGRSSFPSQIGSRGRRLLGDTRFLLQDEKISSTILYPHLIPELWISSSAASRGKQQIVACIPQVMGSSLHCKLLIQLLSTRMPSVCSIVGADVGSLRNPHEDGAWPIQSCRGLQTKFI
uniref:Uncharacterized protein n=1 Tax=Mus musculus TaxID=10090 RepID=Q3UW25_MOUSE|nr:unnamed protein product [Mus musculus]